MRSVLGLSWFSCAEVISMVVGAILAQVLSAVFSWVALADSRTASGALRDCWLAARVNCMLTVLEMQPVAD
jgi:hypothetical protein